MRFEKMFSQSIFLLTILLAVTNGQSRYDLVNERITTLEEYITFQNKVNLYLSGEIERQNKLIENQTRVNQHLQEEITQLKINENRMATKIEGIRNYQDECCNGNTGTRNTARNVETTTIRSTAIENTNPETTTTTTTPAIENTTTSSINATNTAIIKHPAKSVYEDCKGWYDAGNITDGVYIIWTPKREQIHVWCDMQNGGWIVFQKRFNGSVNFNQSLSQYEDGFGEIDGGEFWLGLKYLHQYTKEGEWTMRVDFERFDNTTEWAEYKDFSIGTAFGYNLYLGRPTGTAGNALWRHNGMPFSVYNPNEPMNQYQSCALTVHGGWWFYGGTFCYDVTLNGMPYGERKAMQWIALENDERSLQVLKSSQLKLRRTISDSAPASTPAQETNDEDGNTSQSLLYQYRDCSEWYNAGYTIDGVYTILTPQHEYIDVLCDMQNGGWVVFQKRFDGSVNFNQSLPQYKDGFGEIDGGEFWLGLKYLHQYTKEGEWKLRVDFERFDNTTEWAEYNYFNVGIGLGFKLGFGWYTGGTAGDALRGHRGMPFTVPRPGRSHVSDRQNCANWSNGGWWFFGGTLCYNANVNGMSYGEAKAMQWTSGGNLEILKSSQLKFRRS